ncbi:MAG: hypothetical protein JWP82_2252, partial [Humibacillus sp.]|nr:hypothetical protein [Humibacillus sp.]
MSDRGTPVAGGRLRLAEASDFPRLLTLWRLVYGEGSSRGSGVMEGAGEHWSGEARRWFLRVV